ncbi:hypothetical protein PHYPSEUDO_000953 [Phytophthora pseudosyringae]|uniref:Transmembrane protein 135 N-terminal domain-containing protein n=1 Tax=Phytophthora pseudosyringae TaxID=221518 RepID=A0A8T1VXG8_9STRA|nr:hypothetical protein PHYPSEUDO_000953 [Phytophthora pseudosyringae]
MFDASQQLRAVLTASSPAPHAIRGVSAALAALTALANLTRNRAAVLALLRLRLWPHVKLAPPSRNGLALAVFIGVFRYLQRSASIRAKRKPESTVKACDALVPSGVVPAAAVAAATSTLCMAPESRPAVLSLLSTTAASKLFTGFVAEHPDLRFLQWLELLAFMAADGWIFASGFFYPESYERSHMKQILKCIVMKESASKKLQEAYRQGLNPSPCHTRHEGLSCGQHACGDFLLRVATTSFLMYALVHLTSWVLAQRSRKVRSKPVVAQLKSLAGRLTRSCAYGTGYVYLGWSLCCLLGKLGDRSHSYRKLQLFLSGAIPSLAIFAESPGRRRSIGIILTSYALVSAGNVATRKVPLLQPGGSSVRGFLEAGCVAAAVSAIVSGFLQDNHLLRRMLLGDVEARAFQDALKQTMLNSSCDESTTTEASSISTDCSNSRLHDRNTFAC